jgi:hypothetical protein
MARGIRVNIEGDAGKQFKRSMSRNAAAVRIATRETAFQIAAEITDLGRRDIANAGNFGGRWLDGWQATITEGGGHIVINVAMSTEPPMRYWRVFQDGKTIQGKPLLWIPLSWADDAKGISARDYPGGLFRVDRLAGAPLLLSYDTKEPKYFGKESVTIPKKFHLEEIVAEAVRRIPRVFREQFRQARGNR